jgi:hypothetical protein
MNIKGFRNGLIPFLLSSIIFCFLLSHRCRRPKFSPSPIARRHHASPLSAATRLAPLPEAVARFGRLLHQATAAVIHTGPTVIYTGPPPPSSTLGRHRHCLHRLGPPPIISIRPPPYRLHQSTTAARHLHWPGSWQHRPAKVNLLLFSNHSMKIVHLDLDVNKFNRFE